MTICERLSGREQDDLVDILYRLTGRDCPEMSAPALAEEIARVIGEEPGRLRLCLGQQTLGRWRDWLRHKKMWISDEELEIDYAMWHSVSELTRFGLCDEAENGYLLDAACAPLSRAGKKEEERISQQDMAFTLINGLLVWTGMMESSVLLEQLSRIMPFFSEKEMQEVLIARYGLQTWYRTEAAVPGDPDEIWICYPELDEADLLLAELDSPDVTDLPYADIDVESLIRAHVTGIPASQEALNRCLTALERAGLPADQGMAFLGDVTVETENSPASATGAEAVAAILRDLPNPPDERVQEILRDFCDKLPRWALKGHTPEEASRLFRASRAGMLRPLVHGFDGPKMIPFPRPVRPDPPVAPDAPCPCGSGRPYHSCHGVRN